MQKVLVTGANGFVGSYLLRSLAGQFNILATGRGECRFSFQHKDLHYAQLDFTNGKQVNETFASFLPDTVIHCGAVSKPDDCETNQANAIEVNLSGTAILLNAASVYQSFFIFLSTDFVFDGKQGMYVEEDPVGPVNFYGETKLRAEEKVKQYPYEWAIVRTVLVYGNSIGFRDNVLTSAARSLSEGKKMRMANDQMRTPTFVEDLADAITSIARKKATGIFHISGMDIVTPFEMASAVAEYIGADPNLVEPVTQANFTQAAKRPLKTGFRIDKAIKVLGYKPVRFSEGLKKTIDAFLYSKNDQ